MNKDRIEKILKKNYPNIYRDFSILTLEKDKAKVELIVSDNFMRTATKISNNAIFSLVNITFHVATFFTLGPKPNSMVTNINFNIMRQAPPKNMFAEARILKITKLGFLITVSITYLLLLLLQLAMNILKDTLL